MKKSAHENKKKSSNCKIKNPNICFSSPSQAKNLRPWKRDVAYSGPLQSRTEGKTRMGVAPHPYFLFLFLCFFLG